MAIDNATWVDILHTLLSGLGVSGESYMWFSDEPERFPSDANVFMRDGRIMFDKRSWRVSAKPLTKALVRKELLSLVKATGYLRFKTQNGIIDRAFPLDQLALPSTTAKQAWGILVYELLAMAFQRQRQAADQQQLERPLPSTNTNNASEFFDMNANRPAASDAQILHAIFHGMGLATQKWAVDYFQLQYTSRSSADSKFANVSWPPGEDCCRLDGEIMTEQRVNALFEDVNTDVQAFAVFPVIPHIYYTLDLAPVVSAPPKLKWIVAADMLLNLHMIRSMDDADGNDTQDGWQQAPTSFDENAAYTHHGNAHVDPLDASIVPDAVPPGTCYDPNNMKEIPISTWLEAKPKSNVVIGVDDPVHGFTMALGWKRKNLDRLVKDATMVKFKCERSDTDPGTGAWRDPLPDTENPLVTLGVAGGNLLVSRQQLLRLLRSTARVFAATKSGEEHLWTGSPAGFANRFSADHCQDGSNKKVWNLHAWVPSAQDGGKRTVKTTRAAKSEITKTPQRTDEKVRLPGSQSRERTVYKGARGRKFVRMHNEWVPLADARRR